MNKKITFYKNTNQRKLQREKIKTSKIVMMVTFSVLVSMLILSGTSHAYAVKSLGEDSSIGRVGPNQYGSATQRIVCGVQLCKDAPTTMPAVTLQSDKTIQKDDHMPSITLEHVYPLNGHKEVYVAVFEVAGGDTNLAKAQMSIQSDLEKTVVPIDGLFANDHPIVEIILHAKDPQSITASPISWQYGN